MHDVTPHEKDYGTKLDLDHVRIFGSIAYEHIPNKKRRKLDPKLEKYILIGYSLEQNRYKCFNPSTRKVRVSRDVVFDESTSCYKLETIPTPTPVKPNLANQEIEDEDQLRHMFEESQITMSRYSTSTCRIRGRTMGVLD